MFCDIPDDPAAAAMVMKDGAKEVARDTALHITLVTTTVHEVRMDVTEPAVIHIWSKSKISGELYFSYANYIDKIYS